MSTSSDYLVIGSTPRPTSGAELAHALRSALPLINSGTWGITGIEAIRIEADVAGADISDLDIDLSGVSITVTTAVPAQGAAFGVPIATSDATVKSLRVHASPITINGVAIELDSSADDVPFVWAEDAAGQLAIGERPGATGQTRIRATVEADRDALVAAALALAEDSLADAGVAISDVEVETESLGPREAVATVRARVARGRLAATASFSAHATIDDAMVLHLTDVKVSSRNPLVAALLLTVRQRVEDAVSKPIDLKPMIPAPLRLEDIAISLGERIRAELVLGS